MSAGHDTEAGHVVPLRTLVGVLGVLLVAAALLLQFDDLVMQMLLRTTDHVPQGVLVEERRGLALALGQGAYAGQVPRESMRRADQEVAGAHGRVAHLERQDGLFRLRRSGVVTVRQSCRARCSEGD